MIDRNYIKAQFETSKIQGFTSPILCRLCFNIVDEALKVQYESNYSTRCLQSSFGIQKVLKSFGINSKPFRGSACFLQVFGNNPYQACWKGFWDKDHHVFLITEFNEIVDLTIAQLHIHPNETKSDIIPINPIWWHPIDISPKIFKYLPDVPIKEGLQGTEKEDFDKYLNIVDIKISKIYEKSLCSINFNNILFGINNYEEIYNCKDSWVNLAERLISTGIELPDWIKMKELELIEKFKKKI